MRIDPKNGHVFIRKYMSKLSDGSSVHGVQSYIYDELRDQEIEIKPFKGNWKEKTINGWEKINIVFGIKDEYYDPSF